jgi:serine O-acetyltransferase
MERRKRLVSDEINEKGFFKADLDRYYAIHFGTRQLGLLTRVRFWIGQFGLHCVAVYRLGRFCRRLSAKNRLLALPFLVIYTVLAYVAEGLHHVHIDGASFGPGLYIGHVGTIYAGGKVGANCSLSHNTTIGIGHSQGAVGVPTIGDNVWIGTGSVISGAITIGCGVTISNGSMLSRSVPDRCLVAGNPARVVMRDYDNRELMGMAE